jgi:hypothetical protein
MFLITRIIRTSKSDLLMSFTSYLSLEITISPGSKSHLLQIPVQSQLRTSLNELRPLRI